MKLKSLAVCGLLILWATYSAAQTQAPESQARGEQKEPSSQWLEGIVLDSAFSPDSLDELIANSKLIVKVTVISAYPSTGGTGRDGPVSTDFIVAPQRVLKGQLAADRFVVNQIGGQVEGRASGRPKIYTYYTGAYPGGLMQSGQQYVLFLCDPDRRESPQRDGLERFDTTLGFFGVVRVEQDKVELSRELRWRGGYAGMSAAKFMDEIATKAPLLGPMPFNSREIERLGIINSGAQ